MTTIAPADFLAARFRHNDPDQRIELRSFAPDGKPGPRRWFADPREAARYAATLPRRLAVHYGANPRVEGGGKKEHVAAIVGAHADLDFSRYAAGEAGARAALDAFPLAPTWVIGSGGGLHAYWDLVAPITDRAQFAPFEALLSRLAAAVGGDPAVAEVARVLRLPGSYNSKPEYGAPRPVTIIRHDPAALYALVDFLAILPAPVEPERLAWSPPAGDPRAANRDAPTRDDIREWLRWIAPTGDYKDHWLKVLAAVHSVSPGADGVALCEEWSAGKPGEIARKFASFTRPAGGAGAAGVGTLIYLAQQGGWEPPRHAGPPPSGDPGAPADAARLLTERDALIATLRADVARLGDQLRREQEEGARLVARVTELETENAALEAVIRHPDQAAGVGGLDLLEAADSAYARPRPTLLTQDEKDYARVPFTQAARRRSAKTVARGFQKLRAAGTLDAFTRIERIETPEFKGDVEIAYIHIPPALRGQRGRAVLGILPPCEAPKKHGGRRTIVVPPEVAAQPHPVRRERELLTRWYDALNDEKLVTERPEKLGTDYWTAQGEQRTAAEIEAERVRAGYQPAPAKPWQPTQPALRIGPDPEPRHLAEVSTTPRDTAVSEPRHLADIDRITVCRQDAEVSPPFVGDVPGQCADPDCGERSEIGGYCAVHYPAYSRRYAGVYDFATGAD